MDQPYKEYDYNPYNLPQDLLAATGLAIACASQTEDIVSMAVAGCAGVNSAYGGAIITHMTMPLRLSILRSTAEIRLDDLDALDELDDIIELIEDAFEKRNAIAHHLWARDPETNAIYLQKAKARISYQIDLLPITVDQVKADAALIYEVGMRLMAFLRLHKLLPPIPDRLDRAHKLKAARKNVERNSAEFRFSAGAPVGSTGSFPRRRHHYSLGLWQRYIWRCVFLTNYACGVPVRA
jgi:hypothetical protein